MRGLPESTHCRRLGCHCTHSYPCDRGWIESPNGLRNGIEYLRVTPCPTCRPEATQRADEAAVLAMRGGMFR